MPTEDDLRTAFRGLANHAPDTDTVLTDLRARQVAHRPGLPRFTAALAAAVAVCLIVGLSVAIAGGGQTRHPAAGSSLLDRVPRYYMVLLAKGGSSVPYEAVIRDTVTGKVVATVRPPSPFTAFRLIAGAPDDRTFVLAVQSGNTFGSLPTRLYRAQFNPARRSIQLTRLPIAEFPANRPLSALAVSPHGTELAVALSIYMPGRAAREQIRLYSLASHGVGPAKVWSATGQIGGMSWASTGVLAFNQVIPGQGVRLLSTHARSGSLWRDSRLALKTQAALDRFPAPGDWLLGSGILTTDGAKIAAVAYRYRKYKTVKGKPVSIPPAGSPKIEEFSAATGKLVHVLMPRRPSGRGLFDVGYIAWANSSGSVVVGVVESTIGKSQALQLVEGSLDSHTFKTISGVLRNAEPEFFPDVPGVAF